jgi:hypothetical protein
MRAKLLGAVSAAALLGSVGIANAQGPMQLTDTQLDVVTAGQSGLAFVSASARGARATVSAFLFASPAFASASISARNIASVGTTSPHSVFLRAFAAAPF